jgi:hypothetical protein
MEIPSIAVINFSGLDNTEVKDAVRAVNRQIKEDFMPIWGCGRTCKLHDSNFVAVDMETLAEEQVNADSVIYLIDESTLEGALGYHSINTREKPYGFVFVNPGDWTITLSHEVLELIVDPTVNIFLPGPDPRAAENSEKWLFHSYEVCDAVERFSYKIEGIEVSNFVTPNYFSVGDAPGTQNDFLGLGVTSFGLLEGCHLGVINPNNFTFEQITAKHIQSKGLAPNKACASRFNQFARSLECVKPERPNERRLEQILQHYNQETPKNAQTLTQIRGITRTGRYSKGMVKKK